MFAFEPNAIYWITEHRWSDQGSNAYIIHYPLTNTTSLDRPTNWQNRLIIGYRLGWSGKFIQHQILNLLTGMSKDLCFLRFYMEFCVNNLRNKHKCLYILRTFYFGLNCITLGVFLCRNYICFQKLCIFSYYRSFICMSLRQIVGNQSCSISFFFKQND